MLLFVSAASFSPLSLQSLGFGGEEYFCVSLAVLLLLSLSLRHTHRHTHTQWLGAVLCSVSPQYVQLLAASLADQEHCPFPPNCPCLPYHEEPGADPVWSNPRALGSLLHFE